MSACSCMETVDKRLAEAGANTRLKRSFFMASGVGKSQPATSLRCTATIATEAVEKKRGHTPWAIEPSYCPFCGVSLKNAPTVQTAQGREA